VSPARTLRNWKATPAFRRELERVQQRRQHGPAPARSRTAKGPVRHGADDRNRDRTPASPAQQQPTAEAKGEEKLPSGCRWVGGVPLWGDSDGWPRTGEEHGQRDAYYTARRDSPRPTAATTTRSSASAAKQQLNSAPSAKSKNEAANSHGPNA